MKCKWKESCGYDICMDECCPEFEGVPITNADRIRAMSDAELEKAICNSSNCDYCNFNEGWKGCTLKDWLKQPVEGEHG